MGLAGGDLAGVRSRVGGLCRDLARGLNGNGTLIGHIVPLRHGEKSTVIGG